MLTMLKKLLCKIKGHKRAKNLGTLPEDPLRHYFKCPRCGAQWSRKIKAATAS